MSFRGWLRLLFEPRGRRGAEDTNPGRALDAAYARQLRLRQQMRRGVADMVTSRKRLEIQARQLEMAAARLEAQARTALEQGREELAREALARRSALGSEADDLRQQVTAVAVEERRLLEAAGRLDVQLQRFRARKEAAKAVYGAAQARVRLGEAAAGLGDEDVELRLAVRRAEDRIADMQARAEALEALLASGVLEAPGASRDPFQSELGRQLSEGVVDSQLALLRGQVAGGGQPQLGEDEDREGPRGA